MNVLLDTQALLWFLLDDSRLSEKERKSESSITSD
jgi:PIN domain nuclease of toxin-antitoxin system